MLNSKAITKIQSIILITIIAVTVVVGYTVYNLFSGWTQSSDSIKIGVLADLDAAVGTHVWQSSVLAAEQINAEGGILGRKLEVIGGDTDLESGGDINIVNSAMTRLLTYHQVDFVIGPTLGEIGIMLQDVAAIHKTILISFAGNSDEMTQRVIDDYETYKYFFRYQPANTTQLLKAMIDQLLHVREITGFNKVGYLAEDHPWNKDVIQGFDQTLSEVYNFELVYKDTFPTFSTLDFSSYFASAEAAEVEILLPLIAYTGGIPFIKEYADRQSPMIVYGGFLPAAGSLESWQQTDGKCNYIATVVQPVTVGYPLTSKTVPFRDSYIDRWNESPLFLGAAAYDIIRFVLFDALKKAETTETDAVITALEDIRVETSLASKFIFTTNHDVMYSEGMLSNPNDYGHPSILFQWQGEMELIPIYPMWIMEESGSTYTFPDWSGPWDEIS